MKTKGLHGVLTSKYAMPNKRKRTEYKAVHHPGGLS